MEITTAVRHHLAWTSKLFAFIAPTEDAIVQDLGDIKRDGIYADRSACDGWVGVAAVIYRNGMRLQVIAAKLGVVSVTILVKDNFAMTSKATPLNVCCGWLGPRVPAL